MVQNENPDPNPAEELAIARQAKAIEKIDRLVKGDEPIGEKLKDAVDDHSQTCEEIKQKLGESLDRRHARKAPILGNSCALLEKAGQPVRDARPAPSGCALRNRLSRKLFSPSPLPGITTS